MGFESRVYVHNLFLYIAERIYSYFLSEYFAYGLLLITYCLPRQSMLDTLVFLRLIMKNAKTIDMIKPATGEAKPYRRLYERPILDCMAIVRIIIKMVTRLIISEC